MVYCCILHPDDIKSGPLDSNYCLPATKSTLFKNCNVFDGVSKDLLMGCDVHVFGKKIAKIVPTGTVDFQMGEDDLVLDCEGRTLMPGMIDVHWHTMLAEIDFGKMVTNDFQYASVIAIQTTKKLLLRGFTTVRDAGGNCYGIKLAVDEGIIDGPHIYPSGGT